MGNCIRQLREKRGLTQETLAMELEITQQQLSKYERCAQIKECTNLDGEGIIAVIREADETDVLE